MKSRMVVTLCMLVCASTCTTGCRGEPQATTEVNDKQLSAEQIRKDPMTIAASSVGDFARGHSWYLSVNSAGDASLTIKTVPTKTVRHFKVSRKQLEELREEIIRQDFFGLKDGYGESVLDSSSETIAVTIGQSTKAVRLEYLMNFLQAGDQELLREPVRAIRVRHIVRGWFNDSAAADVRKYEDKSEDFIRGN